jgi:hypothetical protein
MFTIGEARRGTHPVIGGKPASTPAVASDRRSSRDAARLCYEGSCTHEPTVCGRNQSREAGGSGHGRSRGCADRCAQGQGRSPRSCYYLRAQAERPGRPATSTCQPEKQGAIWSSGMIRRLSQGHEMEDSTLHSIAVQRWSTGGQGYRISSRTLFQRLVIGSEPAAQRWEGRLKGRVKLGHVYQEANLTRASSR